MPAFEFNLTDAQVWGIVAYLKNRWPEEVLARHELVNRREP
jgi:mono/diheme cytochrome c family protein